MDHQPINLTEKQIRRSWAADKRDEKGNVVRSYPRGLSSPEKQDQFAAYVERAVRRHDWCGDARRAELPNYELAIGVIVRIEAELRELDGRLRDGSLRTLGFAPREVVHPPAAPTELQPRRVDYTEPAPARFSPPPPLEQPDESDYGNDLEHRGFQVGSIVDTNDDLSWYWGESALATGMSSNWDAMAQRAAMDRRSGEHAQSAPMGPSDRMFYAAGRQSEVMRALRQVPPRLQAVLAVAYEDVRCTQQSVTYYGAGVATIVARAVRVAGSAGLALAQLEAWTAEPGDVQQANGEAVEARLKRAATRLLHKAQAAYRAARWPKGEGDAEQAQQATERPRPARQAFARPQKPRRSRAAYWCNLEAVGAHALPRPIREVEEAARVA